jgi:putative ABC transport system permease protein
MLHENLPLFLAGGLLGAVCAVGSQSLLIRVLPPDLPRTGDIQMDGSVLAFTIALSVAAGLVFGLLPATGSLKADLITPLREGSRGQSQGSRTSRLRRSLVVTQLALAFVLLTSAGLLLRSFLSVLDEQRGARTEHAVTFAVPAPDNRYPDGEAMGRLYADIAARLTRLPNVRSVGYASDIPFEGHWQRLITPNHSSTAAQPVVSCTEIAGDYFQALGLRLINGRPFDTHDRKGTQPVIIVNEAFVRTFWPGNEAVGRSLEFGGDDSRKPSSQVIGVVADTREYSPDERPRPHIYISADQNGYGVLGGQAWFAVSTTGEGNALFNLIRAEVRNVDPSLPVVKLRTMGEVFSTAVAPRRANTWLVSVFALTAVLLTSLGVYGVVAQSVAQRTREIGIRMALGAEHRQVLRSVLWEGGKMVLIGLVAGAAASLAVSRLIQSLLYAVSSNDAAASAASAFALALATLCAVALPAWRATRVDPQVALRDE